DFLRGGQVSPVAWRVRPSSPRLSVQNGALGPNYRRSNADRGRPNHSNRLPNSLQTASNRQVGGQKRAPHSSNWGPTGVQPPPTGVQPGLTAAQPGPNHPKLGPT